ncbi:MAG: hypothetical protein P8Y85_10140 [Nitrospirota bacterium]
MNYRDSGAEDPLDIPTFLRKYEGQGEPRAEEKAKQEVQSANRQF